EGVGVYIGAHGARPEVHVKAAPDAVEVSPEPTGDGPRAIHGLSCVEELVQELLTSVGSRPVAVRRATNISRLSLSRPPTKNVPSAYDAATNGSSLFWVAQVGCGTGAARVKLNPPSGLVASWMWFAEASTRIHATISSSGLSGLTTMAVSLSRTLTSGSSLLTRTSGP